MECAFTHCMCAILILVITTAKELTREFSVVQQNKKKKTKLIVDNNT